MIQRRAAARRLRLVSNSLVARRFEELPDATVADHLLRLANGRAPAGAPIMPGRRPLWLYGAGELGLQARRHLDAMGQPIAGLLVPAGAPVDAAAWAGVEMHAPDAVPERTRAEALLAIAEMGGPYVPLETELNALGWATCAPVHDVLEAFRDGHPAGDGWFAPALTDMELDLASAVLAGFEDDASRAHYLRFAAWRLARQEWDFDGAPVDPSTRVFIPEIVRLLRPDERLLDAGAHHGSIIAGLLEATSGRVGNIWAVEPDPANRQVLQAYVDGMDLALRARIHVLDAVIGARAEATAFHAGLGDASQISSTGSQVRAAIPLDGLSLAPTFVKLNLKGGELGALLGARAMLQNRRPLVVIAVHHDATGLIEIPGWLTRNLPDYAVRMRTHAWCGTDALIYAIPKERTAP
ncbi:FkbM family methyltransferase [Xanthobacteraceae bacterium A53D]